MIIVSRIARLATACIGLLVTAASLSAFEGKIDLKMTADRGEPMPMTYYMKGLKMRTEAATADKKGNQMTMGVAIIDMEKREITILMDEQKAYMIHKIPEPSASSKDKNEFQTDFKPTGRKEVIAGMEAEEYVDVQKRHITEIWVTKALGKMIMENQGKTGSPLGAKGGNWQKFAEQNGFFALRVIQRPKAGAPETMRLETIKIEKKSLPDSLFVPPADYSKFEMPSVGDVMKGMFSR